MVQYVRIMYRWQARKKSDVVCHTVKMCDQYVFVGLRKLAFLMPFSGSDLHDVPTYSTTCTIVSGISPLDAILRSLACVHLWAIKKWLLNSPTALFSRQFLVGMHGEGQHA